MWILQFGHIENHTYYKVCILEIIDTSDFILDCTNHNKLNQTKPK